MRHTFRKSDTGRAPLRVAANLVVLFFASSAQAQFAESIEKARVKHDLPGVAIGLLKVDEKPIIAVAGVRKRGDIAKVEATDQWHLGSNTKPITALLFALLVDLGLIDWDTPLAEIFPEEAKKWPPNLRKVSPRHLLTHTSGLPTLGPLERFQAERSDKETPLEDRASLMKSLADVKLIGEPGTKYEYSNLGYVVLGAIIDRRGKASWEEQIGARVFTPLGIKKWGVGPAGKNDPWPHEKNGTPLADADVRDNSPIYNSAGRLHMSIADYQRILAETLRIANRESTLVKPATAKKLMEAPFAASPHVLGGWIAVRNAADPKKIALTHDGSNTLNYCTAWIVPGEKMAFCCMTNQARAGHRVCEELSKSILKRFGVEP